MIVSTLQERMLACRAEAQPYADQRKDPQIVLDRLEEFYSHLDEQELSEANVILAEWLVSDDQSLRFDARYLVYTCHILSLTEPLQKSARILAASGISGEAEEAVTVRDLVQKLLAGRLLVMPPQRRSPSPNVNAGENVS